MIFKFCFSIICLSVSITSLEPFYLLKPNRLIVYLKCFIFFSAQYVWEFLKHVKANLIFYTTHIFLFLFFSVLALLCIVLNLRIFLQFYRFYSLVCITSWHFFHCWYFIYPWWFFYPLSHLVLSWILPWLLSGLRL